MHPRAGPPAGCSQQDPTPLSAALFPQPRWRTGSTGEALPQPRGSRQQPLVPNEWDLHCAGAGGNSLICNLCACHMSLQRQVLTAGSKRWGLAGRTKRNRRERALMHLQHPLGWIKHPHSRPSRAKASGAARTQQVNNAICTLAQGHPSSDMITSPLVPGCNVNYVTVIEGSEDSFLLPLEIHSLPLPASMGTQG